MVKSIYSCDVITIDDLESQKYQMKENMISPRFATHLMILRLAAFSIFSV